MSMSKRRGRGQDKGVLPTRERLQLHDDNDKKKKVRLSTMTVIEYTLSLFLTVSLVVWVLPFLPSLNYVRRIVFSEFNLSFRSNDQFLKPRILRIDTTLSNVAPVSIEFDNKLYRKKRVVKYPMIDPSELEALADSKDYDNARADRWETRKCKAMHEWQKKVFPTCSLLHEFDLSHPIEEKSKLLANGYWRDVWWVKDTGGNNLIVKTIRYEHDYTHRNYDRHRRDALAMERLTKSPYILDIYGYCSNSAITEFADGGDITKTIWKDGYDDDNAVHKSDISNIERLQIATQAAIALADFHNIDEEGKPSMAHTDITPTQFVKVGNRFKLNDFNRVRFLTWNEKKNKACPYEVGKNPGKFRSPEEYAYDWQTEKVDVYSLGNVIYVLLMNAYPWHGFKEKDARERVKKGKRPIIFEDIWNSEDPIIKVMVKAMIACHLQDPDERATSRQIADMLKAKLDEVDPGFLDSLK